MEQCLFIVGMLIGGKIYAPLVVTWDHLCIFTPVGKEISKT